MNGRNPTLAICIPTYNRALLLQELLDSIDYALCGQIEICISDNCSNDKTEQVIRNFLEKTNHKVIYIKQAENIGADANFLEVVRMASAKYCWLIGSDDKFKLGALTTMLSILRDHEPDIVLSCRTNCSAAMEVLCDEEWLDVSSSKACYDLTSRAATLQYLRSAKALGSVFSYLSNITVRREAWVNAGDCSDFYGTAYAHVAKIVRMIKCGTGNLVYVNDKLVYNRGNNDSFLRSAAQRINLDIAGFYKIFDIWMTDLELYGEAENLMRRSLRHATRYGRTWALLSLRAQSDGDDAVWEELQRNWTKLFGDTWRLRIVNFLPRAACVWVRNVARYALGRKC